MVTILQKDSPVLRETAKPVAQKEFGTAALKKIINDMALALDKEEDGVAIAAPQIGISKRIFVVSHRAFESAGKKKSSRPRRPCLHQSGNTFYIERQKACT